MSKDNFDILPKEKIFSEEWTGRLPKCCSLIQNNLKNKESIIFVLGTAIRGPLTMETDTLSFFHFDSGGMSTLKGTPTKASTPSGSYTKA